MSEATYHSYLLRLWRDHAGAPWRATVTDVARPGEQQHFASLEALWAFLSTQATRAAPDAHSSCALHPEVSNGNLRPSDA